MNDEKHRTDRRDFMKKSGLLATALSVGAAPAFTQDPLGGDNLVKVGWIGTGGRGNHLMRKVVKLPNVKVTALCDLWPPNLERAKGTSANPNVETYQRHEEMLEKADIDCAVVTSPLHWHAPHSIAAMKAGKDVFCEKTMAVTIEDANEMVRTSRETGKFVQVGLQRRYSPIYRKAVHMIFNEGLLGRITLIRCQWHRNYIWRRPHIDLEFPPGKEYDLARQYYPDMEHFMNWRMYWEYSGGLMTELGSHQLDVCSWVLGGHPTAGRPRPLHRAGSRTPARRSIPVGSPLFAHPGRRDDRRRTDRRAAGAVSGVGAGAVDASGDARSGGRSRDPDDGLPVGAE